MRPYRQEQKVDLHSNMVIFIINGLNPLAADATGFTFQYGYIYYFVFIVKFISIKDIYIPIWLYLLSNLYQALRSTLQNLHSNMVIFIIYLQLFSFHFWIAIYIPIWLYLLSIIKQRDSINY